MTNRTIFLKSFKAIGFVLLVQLFLLSFFFVFKMALWTFFGVEWIVNLIGLATFLTILTTIGGASYFYEVNRENQRRDELRRQKDLLESLYTELDAISNKNKKIKFEEGNLQWFKDAVGVGKPLHSVWSINPSPYLSYLSSVINGKETRSIKRKLVRLNQKIEMINGIVLSGEYNLGIFGQRETRDEQMLKFVKKVIDEMIDLTEEMKKRLVDEFKVKPLIE